VLTLNLEIELRVTSLFKTFKKRINKDRVKEKDKITRKIKDILRTYVHNETLF
jgi:hypothetical protein